MALVGINPGRERSRKPSKLEQIAMGVDIATKVLGTGISGYDLVMKRQDAGKDLELKNESNAIAANKDFRPATEGETPEFIFRDQGMVKRPSEMDPFKAAISALTAEKLRKDIDTSPFKDAAEKTLAKDYADLQSGALKADEQLNLIDDSIRTFEEYSKNSMAGTGPLATGFGLKKYFDEPTQNLEAKFNLINLKNMTAMFAGMSKAVDSDTERRAWQATQPSLSNDDDVNRNILLGAKALALKAKMEAKAQKDWVEGPGKGSLLNYESPVLGKTSAVVSSTGDMKIIPSGNMESARKQGYMSIDDYVKFIGAAPKKEKSREADLDPIEQELRRRGLVK